MSSATVTPSLVTFGEPHPLSSTALRPRGPNVLRTACAQLRNPCQQRLPGFIIEHDLLCHSRNPPVACRIKFSGTIFSKVPRLEDRCIINLLAARAAANGQFPVLNWQSDPGRRSVEASARADEPARFTRPMVQKDLGNFASPILRRCIANSLIAEKMSFWQDRRCGAKRCKSAARPLTPTAFMPGYRGRLRRKRPVQAHVAAAVTIGQPRVVDAQKMQHRGVQIVDR